MESENQINRYIVFSCITQISDPPPPLPPNLGNLILFFLHVTTTFCSYDIDMIWYDMITMITMMIAMIVKMMLMIILVFNDDKSEVF